MKRIFELITATVICLMIAGCGGSVPDAEPTVDPADSTDSASSIVEPVAPPVESSEDRDSEFPLDPPANAPVDDPPSEPGTTDTTAAKVGVGKKGQGYGGGLVSEPARQYFRIQERVVFDVRIPQALNTYKAINEKPPQTHDEFMEKIINENGIKLPELSPGKKYLFDPQKGELMIQTGG